MGFGGALLAPPGGREHLPPSDTFPGAKYTKCVCGVAYAADAFGALKPGEPFLVAVNVLFLLKTKANQRGCY